MWEKKKRSLFVFNPLHHRASKGNRAHGRRGVFQTDRVGDVAGA